MLPQPHQMARYVHGVILTSSVAHAAVQLLNIQESAYPDLSSTCISVLNQEVSCDATLGVVGAGERLSGVHRILEESDLEALCTDGCASGLDTWTRRVAGACDGARVPAGAETVTPDVWANKYLEAFDSVCLVGGDGSFCNPVIGSAFGIDPVNQDPTAEADASAPCNTCFLSLIQTQLGMPLAYTDALEDMFTSLTSSCSETEFTLPTRATNDWIETATTGTDDAAEPTPTCDGTTYEISEGETCQDISAAAGISTLRLLLANNLGSFCSNFPASGSLCIPDDATCTPYTVEEGDTCASIAKAQEKTYTQIVSWNPELGRDCQNIKRHVGYAICVSSPGGEWVNPRPVDRPTSTSTTKTWIRDGMTPIDQMPVATRVPNENFTVIDWAPDTRQDCRVYHVGGAPVGGASNATSTACDDVAAQFRITLEELLFWNPSLTEGDECALRDDAQYCVGMVEAIAEDMTEACVSKASATFGDDCRTFRIRYAVSDMQFVAWNPVVGEDCSDFTPGMTYCVGVEHFKSPGVISTCNKFVTPEETRLRMKPCQIMEEEYGLSHERFVAWNPEVGDACTAVFPGYDYCVSIPNYQPTFSSSSAEATEEPQTTTTEESQTTTAA